MKLSDFENYITPVILQRGFDYFKAGKVRWIDMKDSGIVAGVEGMADYRVVLAINEAGDINYSECDCPYDQGSYCKHQAAVFYALRERNLSGESVERKAATEASPKDAKDDLGPMLARLDIDDLRQIILNITSEHQEIAKALLVKYASKENEMAACKKLMHEYIRKAKRNGFIDWRQAGYGVKGIALTLEKAQDRLGSGDIAMAVGLCLAALPITVDMLQYCDDSDGCVGDVIRDNLSLLDEAAGTGAECLGISEQKQIMAKIMKEALNGRYDGWDDWRFDLLGSCIYFCAIPEFRKKLETQLGTLLAGTMGQDGSAEYRLVRIKLLELEIIERFDDPQKAEDFIAENIHHSEFREKAVKIAINKQEYEKVLQLSAEGEQADEDYAGLVHKWMKYRYFAYEKLGDMDNQRKLALRLVYDRDFDYFVKLKGLYSSALWSEVREDILAVFENMAYQPDIYVKILIEENLTNRILIYCQRNPAAIMNLYKYLKDEYGAEVSLLFRKHIEHSAGLANNRAKYKQVCAIIKTYKKVCGDINARQIIADLQRNYPRRPAFLEELRKQ